MRDIASTGDFRPEEYGDPKLDNLFNRSDIGTLTDEEKEKYDEAMTTVEDLTSYWKEQVEHTRQATHAEDQRTIAKSLLESGIAVEIVSKCTGLSIEEIQALR